MVCVKHEEPAPCFGHKFPNRIRHTFPCGSRSVHTNSPFPASVKNESDGRSAGEMARHLTAPHDTMSLHIGVLSWEGLVRSERRIRAIIHRADVAQCRDVVAASIGWFLRPDALNGSPAYRINPLKIA